MKIWVGTSGFSYPEWKGKFYPQKIRASEMLRFYGERFSAVEVNNTFYKLPERATFEKWLPEVPAEFRFALKAQNYITHIRRLRPAKRAVTALLKLGTVFGEQLGPVLFQLPPNFKKDTSRLKAFVRALPKTHRFAFEFRNESWFAEDVFEALREHNIALCIAESEDTPPTPAIATTDWGYLRLRRMDYRPRDLQKWARFVSGQQWTEAFVFFKHEETARGPAFAKRFNQILGNFRQ